MTGIAIIIALVVIGILQARLSNKYRQAELDNAQNLTDTDIALNELKGR